jgi:hypothetical protein
MSAFGRYQGKNGLGSDIQNFEIDPIHPRRVVKATRNGRFAVSCARNDEPGSCDDETF